MHGCPIDECLMDAALGRRELDAYPVIRTALCTS
jgi:hypothetical protein